MQRWWERWPERLALELEALDKVGIQYRQDDELFARDVLALHLKPEFDGECFDLIAIYPDVFPYFRFEVFAPQLSLERHQHPFSKSLCLIGRASVLWRERDTVADFIRTRLPELLKAARTTDAVVAGALEEHQGEPFSDYYSYPKDTMVLFDTAKFPGSAVREGTLDLRVPEGLGLPLRGVTGAFYDQAGRLVGATNERLEKLHPKLLRARWVRCNAAIRENQPKQFLDEVLREYPALARLKWQGIKGWKIDAVAVLFPEEVSWRDHQEGCLFLVRAQDFRDRGRQKEAIYLRVRDEQALTISPHACRSSGVSGISALWL